MSRVVAVRTTFDAYVWTETAELKAAIIEDGGLGRAGVVVVVVMGQGKGADNYCGVGDIRIVE